VRAVQDLSASQALEFVFLLKRVIVEEFGEDLEDPSVAADLASLHSGIDRLALRAFDHFVRCREQIYDLRAREFRRRTASLLRRLERYDEGTEAEEPRHTDPSTGGRRGNGGSGG
jgi:hypothetical protein